VNPDAGTTASDGAGDTECDNEPLVPVIVRV
jgi:hypothetical protein